jgi:hypothetical protein
MTARRLAALPLVALVTALAGIMTGGQAQAAPPPPTVAVSPSSGLVRGSLVTIKASGVSPSTLVRVVECDRYNDDPETDCPGGRAPSTSPGSWSTTSSPAGRVSLKVKLADPVFRAREFGDAAPVYCRADLCRLFLVWEDPAGARQVLGSDPLTFVGSPATVHMNPSSNLAALKWVAVTGTARGAEGRTIKVLEQGCFDMIQGRGCYGQLPVKWGKVRTDGSFKVKYPAQRHLGDDPATDCADPGMLGQCVLSVIVLDTLGRHDDSFGVRDYGDPAASLSFAASSHG